MEEKGNDSFLKVVEFKPKPQPEPEKDSYVAPEELIQYCETLLEGVKSGAIRNVTVVYVDDSDPEYPFAYNSSAWWSGWAGHQKLCHAVSKANFRAQQRMYSMEDNEYLVL